MRTVVRSLNLRKGIGDVAQIDSAIRSGVVAAGTNLWVLMFAILIASVGLNVNSTAAIIGAMLISPLMGPIVGVGYALALSDFGLIRLAARNLLVFTLISLGSSTLYFTISPLDSAGSELLARTSPTLWDVLIAFFGGAAGIVAITRRNVSTVIPGVAIATALMPPLCTAGFAISQQRWDWVAGALYLYAINSVFIAYATLLFVKLMRLGPARERSGTRAAWLTALTILAVTAPSVYLGWRLVQAQVYATGAAEVVRRVTAAQGVIVLDSRVDAEQREITVTVAGEDAPERLAETLRSELATAGQITRHLEVRSASGRPLDAGGIKREIQSELSGQLARQLDTLKSQVQDLRQQRQAEREASAALEQLAREIEAQHPVLGPVSLLAPDPGSPVWLRARWSRLNPAEMGRLNRWLEVRLQGRPFELLAPVSAGRTR